MTREEHIAHILLDIEAVMLNVEEPFRYTSGILSPIYCDNRLLIAYPQKRDAVISGFLDLMNEKELDYDVIGGIATAGIPHAAIIADRLDSPMIYIRNKPKEHGRKNLIEGHLEEGAHVLLIEDLISTGGSSLKAAEGVREEGGVVMDCLAIFTYQMKAAEEAFAAQHVRLHTLTHFNALVEVARKEKLVREEDVAKILEWNQDPSGWGKKHGYE